MLFFAKRERILERFALVNGMSFPLVEDIYWGEAIGSQEH